MPIVPKNPADQITFYTTHVPEWAGDPAAIGLLPGVVAELQDKLDAAVSAQRAVRLLRDEARSATFAYRTAVRDLHARGSAAIATIKAFAQTTSDAGVYVQASIAPPRRGAPLPAPEAPTNVHATINASGELRLEWDAATAGPSTGVFFQVFRRGLAGGDAEREGGRMLAATAETVFIDPRPLAGGSSYIVRAVRGDKRSANSTAIAVTLPGGSDSEQRTANSEQPEGTRVAGRGGRGGWGGRRLAA